MELSEALQAGTYKSRVHRDLHSGKESGVTGTPMFYINGQLYRDSYDFPTFAAAIEDAAS
jgi:protein-disulfide isomerase